MRKTLYLLVFVLALALAYAAAQTSSSSTGSSQAPTQSQSPSTTNQTTPSTTAPTGATPTTPDVQTSPSTTSAPSTGGELQGQIQNALKNEPTLANDAINVSVSDSEIELAGTVATGKEKLTARRIVQSFAGNRKVKDHLTVGGQENTRSNETPASNTGSNGKPTGDKPPRK